MGGEGLAAFIILYMLALSMTSGYMTGSMAWLIILGSDMIIACTLICNFSKRETCAQNPPVSLGAAELYAAS